MSCTFTPFTCSFHFQLFLCVFLQYMLLRYWPVKFFVFIFFYCFLGSFVPEFWFIHWLQRELLASFHRLRQKNRTPYFGEETVWSCFFLIFFVSFNCDCFLSPCVMFLTRYLKVFFTELVGRSRSLVKLSNFKRELTICIHLPSHVLAILQTWITVK